jgi:DNA ligase-1
VDVNTGELLPFQMVSHRRGRKYGIEKIVEEIPVVLFIFDVMYLNGEDMTSRPYPERRKALEGWIEPGERVKLSHRIVSEDVDEIKRFFNQAIQDGCEGLVAKNIGEESIYRAGAREFLWIKYKRDYRVEMADTTDLVVVGAFAGKGRRKGTYGALLMAAYNPEKDRFETVCKLGSGFTDEQLAALPKMFEGLKREKRHPRVWSEIEADYWFDPVKVLEVIGAEITLSPIHTCARDAVEKGTGLAIRFPRFTGRWRDDKRAEDATTVQELVEMYQAQVKNVKK